jgi:pimeloyl-ACP methyl ester carboxylesterase
MNRMKKFTVMGKQVSYEKMGKGPLVVLLHGWANSWEAWLPLIPFLSDHFTLIIPDLPGFGGSEGPKNGWSTDEYAAWLEKFLDEVITLYKLPISAVIGHSYGGKLAALYQSEKRKPEIKKLILIDASGIPRTLTTKQKSLALLSRLTPPWIKSTVSSHLREKVYTTFGADSDYLTENKEHKATLRKILHENLSKKLSFIDIPTLIIWGKKDTATPIEIGEKFHKLISPSTFKTYNSGHFPHHEYATEVARDIIKFI